MRKLRSINPMGPFIYTAPRLSCFSVWFLKADRTKSNLPDSFGSKWQKSNLNYLMEAHKNGEKKGVGGAWNWLGLVAGNNIGRNSSYLLQSTLAPDGDRSLNLFHPCTPKDYCFSVVTGPCSIQKLSFNLNSPFPFEHVAYIPLAILVFLIHILGRPRPRK